MKKNIVLLAVSMLFCLFNSCELLTLHPIFTGKELVFDPRLQGTWKNEKGETLQYSKASANDVNELSEPIRQHTDKIFILTRNDDAGLRKYYAFLVKLGPNYFFDYYPLDVIKSGQVDDFYKSHYIRMHSISRVTLLNNTSMKISHFEDDYLEKLIRQKNIRIRHEDMGDGKNYFITASTGELQQYILKYANTPEAYGSPEGSLYKKIQ